MTPCTWQHLRWWEQYLHPGQLRPCGGYWFHSGIGSNLGLYVGLLTFLVACWHRVNCHEPRCPKIGRHHHHASGTTWCKRHMPQELIDTHPKPHRLGSRP